ncbi:hypothetical protein BG000_001052 [Podila horticola]|nr:hypothetical protein BG000_001052 [Podila horticola]
MVTVLTNKRRLLLGLSLAVSLFLCASAFPASIPFIQYRHPQQQQEAQEQSPPDTQQPEEHTTTQGDSANSRIFKDQDPLSTKTYDQDLRDQKQETSSLASSPFQSVLPDPEGGGGGGGEGTEITRPEESPLFSSSSSSSSSIESFPPSSSSSSLLPFPPKISPHSHQRHDLESLFHRATASRRDQVLHQCTVHYLALLDSEISDRLLAQLSRLVMMLPVIGVETRAVIRTKVMQVVQQASQGLTAYESIQRVIRTAVDDAGLLRMRDLRAEKIEENKKTTTMKKGLKKGGRPWRIQYVDEGDQFGPTIFEDNQQDNNNNRNPGELENEDMDEEDDEEEDNNNNIGAIENEENEEKEASWFGLASRTASSASSSSSTSPQPQQENAIDESQIPEVVDVAMEAVLEYMAEVLTPSLVIHQLTEAIQTTLHDMSKKRKLRLQEQQRDTASQSDNDINSLSQSPGRAHHGLDLLADDWVWSGDLNGDDDEDGRDDSDPRGQDEDLWDKDMEVNQWDSTGRLFEDFQDDVDEETDLPSSASPSPSGSEPSREDKDDVWDVSEEEDDQDGFSIGIQDGGGDRYDDEDDDEDLDTLEEYEQRERRQRFQKRDMTPAVVAEDVASPPKVSKRGLYPAVFLNRARRPGFAPDPRLENLLTQLMEPLLRSFIEEEFPASCKRVQGELMDGILWMLDHKESETSELDQLVLLAELEF